MIFVTVGTYEVPFDRLLRAVADLPIEERLVVQYGSSAIRPEHAECVGFLDYDEVVGLLSEARLVITHAGVGSVIASLAAGKRPVVVPRRQSFGETVDDHQVTFARKLAARELVTLVEEPADLARVIAEGSSVTSSVELDPRRLAGDLARWVEAQLSSAGKPRPRSSLPTPD